MYRRRKRSTDGIVAIGKVVCCLLREDREAGSPLLRAIVEKATGIRVEIGSPKRLITAKRV